MDQRIIDLMSTTFPGRRLTRRRTADIQETVALLPNDSRNELGGPSAGIPAGWWRRAPAGSGPASACRDAGGPRHPGAAGEAGGKRPRHEGRRQAGLDLRPGPAAGDRGAAVRATPAGPGSGHRYEGQAAVERVRRPPPPSRLQDAPSGRMSAIPSPTGRAAGWGACCPGRWRKDCHAGTGGSAGATACGTATAT